MENVSLAFDVGGATKAYREEIEELKVGVREYIYKYNFKRFHSAIQYQKPMNVYLNEIQNVA